MRHVSRTICIQLPCQQFCKIVKQFLIKYRDTYHQVKEQQIYIYVCVCVCVYIKHTHTHTHIDTVNKQQKVATNK